MQKVKVSPTRNEIYSNVKIQYKYHKVKTHHLNNKNLIFLHSSKNLGVTLQAEVPAHRQNGHTTDTKIWSASFQQLCVYAMHTIWKIWRGLHRATVDTTNDTPNWQSYNAGLSCIQNFKLLQNIYKLIRRQTKLFQYLTICISFECCA